MSKPLVGQGAIVTGGARGIGLGIAKRLAAEGCRIALWDLSFQPFSATAAGFTPISIQTVDIADLKAVQHAYEATLADLGDIDERIADQFVRILVKGGRAGDEEQVSCQMRDQEDEKRKSGERDKEFRADR